MLPFDDEMQTWSLSGKSFGWGIDVFLTWIFEAAILRLDSFEETNKQTLLLLLLLFPMMSGIYYFPCFSNPNTGQKFYKRKDLDQYLAFSRKYKLPRECKWETPDIGSSSRSIDRRAKTKSKSKGKNRTKGKGIAKAKSKEKGITKAKLKPKGDIAKAKPEARASGHR